MSERTTRITKVGTVVLPVNDQDEALELFVSTLGFETRLDAEFAPGQRWIEVAPPGAETSIALAAASLASFVVYRALSANAASAAMPQTIDTLVAAQPIPAGTMITRLEVKTPGPELPVSSLSGGNQQKVVMARALAGDPRLLVLITPTAGVDVRSKEFLLGKVEETAATGTGVLIASDELDDLRMCDRVLVMFQGHVT